MSPSYPPTAIVILNWNSEEVTAQALASLRQAELCGARRMVVDNASQDGSDLNLVKRFPEIELLRLPENRGYAGGCNAGIKRALDEGCEAIFIMNNDVIVERNFLAPLLRKLEDQTVGLVGGKIYFPGEPARFQSAGSSTSLWTGTTRHHYGGQVDVGQMQTDYQPQSLSGAAILLTRRLVETVGRFDEKLFIYYEETDLCWRARAAGFKVLFTPESHVWHLERKPSEGHLRAWEQYYMLRNVIIFIRRHANWQQKAFFLFHLFCYRFPKEVVRSLRKRGRVSNVFRAMVDGIFFRDI